jgi:predicted nucleic acid-binding protein
VTDRSAKESMKRSTVTEPLFIDTWGWLVLADARDPLHSKVVLERRKRARLVTTDYVLDELLTRLFARAPFAQAKQFSAAVFEAIQRGLVMLEPITPDRFQAAYSLRLRFRDKPKVSFTDLTSFVVMQETGIHDVLTADGHFSQVGLGFRNLP